MAQKRNKNYLSLLFDSLCKRGKYQLSYAQLNSELVTACHVNKAENKLQHSGENKIALNTNFNCFPVVCFCISCRKKVFYLYEILMCFMQNGNRTAQNRPFQK